MKTQNGDDAYFLISVRQDRHPDYDDDLLLTTAVEITEQHKLQERLEHRARHDDLTGLLNRRALFDRSEQVLSMCDREGRRAAVLYIDKGANPSLYEGSAPWRSSSVGPAIRPGSTIKLPEFQPKVQRNEA